MSKSDRRINAFSSHRRIGYWSIKNYELKIKNGEWRHCTLNINWKLVIGELEISHRLLKLVIGDWSIKSHELIVTVDEKTKRNYVS